MQDDLQLKVFLMGGQELAGGDKQDGIAGTEHKEHVPD